MNKNKFPLEKEKNPIRKNMLRWLRLDSNLGPYSCQAYNILCISGFFNETNWAYKEARVRGSGCACDVLSVTAAP